MDRTDSQPTAVRGILARVMHFQVWLHVVIVAATVASSVRYVQGHGLGDRAPFVLGGAVLLLAVYAADPRRFRPSSTRLAASWCAGVISVWLGLTFIAPSFSWIAVPLAFVALQVMPFAPAAALITGMTAAIAVAWSRMQGRWDPTVIVGPVSIAALTVIAYRALEQEALTRRRLLDDLRDAQGDLSEAQHTAGVLAERARLSRDIHDSVAQAMSSINLLLQAAEQHWTTRPAAAREHVHQAALAARDGLDEVRRVVRDLAPAERFDDPGGAALPAALRRACAGAVAASGVHVEVHVHGEPVAVAADAATAVLRTARGALANVVEHSGASTVAVSLTYQPDELILDVRDDGRGFVPERVAPLGDRGRGLAGIAARARQHGGSLAVESGPGQGTALALSIPMQAPG